MASRYKKYMLILALILFSMSISTLAGKSPGRSTVMDVELQGYKSLENAVYQNTANCRKIKSNDKFIECMINIAELILSKRDINDGGIQKLFDHLRISLNEPDKAQVVIGVTQRQINILKDKKKAAEMRATSVEILKNLISELRAEVEYYKPVFELIKEAELSIDEPVQIVRFKWMLTPYDPSSAANFALQKTM